MLLRPTMFLHSRGKPSFRFDLLFRPILHIDKAGTKTYNIDVRGDRMDNYTPDVLTVTDGSGQELQYQILDRLTDTNGETCLAVIPLYENSEDILSDDVDFDIVRLKEENGGFVLSPVDSESEFASLYKKFVKRIDDMLYGNP